jgi:hypothetical protein
MFENFRKVAPKAEAVVTDEAAAPELTADDVAMIARIMEAVPEPVVERTEVAVPKVDENLHPVSSEAAVVASAASASNPHGFTPVASPESVVPPPTDLSDTFRQAA